MWLLIRCLFPYYKMPKNEEIYIKYLTLTLYKVKQHNGNTILINILLKPLNTTGVHIMYIVPILIIIIYTQNDIL